MQFSAALLAALLSGTSLVTSSPTPVYQIGDVAGGSNPWVGMYSKDDSLCTKGYFEAKAGDNKSCSKKGDCRPTLSSASMAVLSPGAIPDVGHLGIFWGDKNQLADKLFLYSDATCTTHMGTVVRPNHDFGNQGKSCVGATPGDFKQWAYIHCVSLKPPQKDVGLGPFVITNP
ncbi:uncharacterized protein KY384_005346 [Bacidia gigantensis]|uniref:uncharacterized protein n=1 Tax=Bacidia gigantensis TaxID=2732470 RepID=UPI001D03AA79|nr:uncharacterized protein KY384_005346 [Bacidia gigantensis]KAG8529865.1 hypothetical protein KY384_005346 [Bacidia gigantensis]